MCFHEIKLDLVIVVLGLRHMINCSFLLNCVVNNVIMICSDVLLCLKPINIVPKPFWVIGGLKMGFLDENGVRNRRLNSAQMNTRLSEMPFAQASNTLLRPV